MTVHALITIRGIASARWDPLPVCLGEAGLLEEEAVLVEAQLLGAQQLSCDACQAAAEHQVLNDTVIPASLASAAQS